MSPEITPEALPIDQSQIDALVQENEQRAIGQIAEGEGHITDIRDAHKEAIREQMMGQVRGSDGAALDRSIGETAGEAAQVPTESVVEQAMAQVDAQADEREGRFASIMRVSKFAGNQVGEERDDTRTIYVDVSMASVQTQEVQAKEVNDHEFRHMQQVSTADVMDVPQTGDAKVDALLQVEHKAYREEDAMFIAGDAFTSHQYTTDFKKPVQDVAAYLDSHGGDGQRLVREAGHRGKVADLHRAILRAHFHDTIGEVLRN